jgi:hypothetical protein
MYNKITLIGTVADRPQEMYHPDGNLCVRISLSVPRLLMLLRRTGASSSICVLLAVAQVGRLVMIPFS